MGPPIAVQPWHKFYASGAAPDIDINRWPSIASLLTDACQRFGDQVALTCMGHNITYRQLDRLSTALAAYLQGQAGLSKGDRLAIMLPNVMQFPITFLAAQKLGVVCVNTNPLYTPREMEHQFKDSGAKAIVIIDLFADQLEKIIHNTAIKTVIVTSVADQLPSWKSLLVKTVMRAKRLVPAHSLQHTSFQTALGIGARQKIQEPRLNHEDLALLQYTGGTTGVSKGAMLLQRNILANIAQIRNCASSHVSEGQEVVLTALPLYHIFALTVNFLTFLAMGMRMILVPKPIPIENTVRTFKKFPITVMTGVNTLFNGLNNNADFRKTPPRGMKIALGGGMAVQAAVGKRWQQLTGIPLIEGYGLTEAAPVTHVNPLDGRGRVGSIGVPVASTLARVVDENGKDVALGETGELVVKGPQVMVGYWQKPDETAKVLRDNWLYTGDMARRDDDGFFYIVDRKKDMILVSGFNVYPNEIEDVLMTHPKVLEAAVVGVPDKASGESVKAFVVPKDPSLTVDELRKYCSDNLTGYKRPRQYELRDSLPKTNVGKILRRALRSDATGNPSTATHVAP